MDLRPGPSVVKAGVFGDVFAEVRLEDVDPRAKGGRWRSLNQALASGFVRSTMATGAFQVSAFPASRTRPSGRGASDNP